MILIYNNEKREYRIKIWASKSEKKEIKSEYNKIIKKICDNKEDNNILTNILKLKPDKYTIYYFPFNVTLFEKELVFIYILFITQKEKYKYKFQNFKQIKDLITYSKSFLIPKINDLLDKFTCELKIYNINETKKNISKIKNRFSINENKENILINNIHLDRSYKYISKKNDEIIINFDTEIFKKAIKKNKKYNSKKIPNLMKRPYNKKVFNYSLEKKDNDNSFNIIQDFHNYSIDKIKRPKYNFKFNTNKNESDKEIKNINFQIYKFKNLKKERTNKDLFNNIPFSYHSKNTINRKSIPYGKKRPSSFSKKIIKSFSTNNLIIKNNNFCNVFEDYLNLYNNSIFDNKIQNKNNIKIIYKKKIFSKKRSNEKKGYNSNHYLRKIYSLNNNDDLIFYKSKKNNNFQIKNNDAIRNKNNIVLFHSGSMVSFNNLKKFYVYIKDIN